MFRTSNVPYKLLGFRTSNCLRCAASNHIDKLSRFYFWQTRKIFRLHVLMCYTFSSANVVVVTVVTCVGAIQLVFVLFFLSPHLSRKTNFLFRLFGFCRVVGIVLNNLYGWLTDYAMEVATLNVSRFREETYVTRSQSNTHIHTCIHRRKKSVRRMCLKVWTLTECGWKGNDRINANRSRKKWNRKSKFIYNQSDIRFSSIYFFVSSFSSFLLSFFLLFRVVARPEPARTTIW